MATSRIALTTAVVHRLVLALLTPLVNRAVTLALMGSLAGGGFIGAPGPAWAEPEWASADGSRKDTEEVGWPTPSKYASTSLQKCHHYVWSWHISKDPFTTLNWRTWQWLYDELTLFLYWNIIKTNKNPQPPKVSPVCMNFWWPPIANSIDELDNDYLINWPYFCIETSSKPTVINSLQKCDQCVWISDDPL